MPPCVSTHSLALVLSLTGALRQGSGPVQTIKLGQFVVKWLQDNLTSIIVAVRASRIPPLPPADTCPLQTAYEAALPITYMDVVLKRTLSHIQDALDKRRPDFPPKAFALKDLVTTFMKEEQERSRSGPARHQQRPAASASPEESSPPPSAHGEQAHDSPSSESPPSVSTPDSSSSPPSPSSSPADEFRNIAPASMRLKAPGPSTRGPGKRKDQQPASPRQASQLDYTDSPSKGNKPTAALAGQTTASGAVDSFFDPDAPKAGSVSGSGNSSTGGGVLSFFKKLVTFDREATREDLDPVLDRLRKHLVSMNVAVDVSESLTEAVANALVGKKLGTFETLSSLVHTTMRQQLERILAPAGRVDLLAAIDRSTKENRPYSMVMCGVNGVGKSTNLSKIAYWLLSNNFRVLIAACDTFRSGAVEQLRTHVNGLNRLMKYTGDSPDDAPISLYDSGYGKNPSDIAHQAIQFAKANKRQVVLIDTAGRMQDNIPLMQALAELVRVNVPDLILFVGDALAGACTPLVCSSEPTHLPRTQETTRLISCKSLTSASSISETACIRAQSTAWC
jgi:signal recognition particle GTPase